VTDERFGQQEKQSSPRLSTKAGIEIDSKLESAKAWDPIRLSFNPGANVNGEASSMQKLSVSVFRLIVRYGAKGPVERLSSSLPNVISSLYPKYRTTDLAVTWITKCAFPSTWMWESAKAKP
jgi:hypothetical protein